METASTDDLTIGLSHLRGGGRLKQRERVPLDFSAKDGIFQSLGQLANLCTLSWLL